MKILIYGDCYINTSGFAKEFRDIIPELLKRGHEVKQVALNYSGFKPVKTIIPIYPTQLKGVKDYFASEVLDMALDDFQPDILFSIQDYFVTEFMLPAISKPRKKPFKWVHWGVLDGAPLDQALARSAAWANLNLFHSKFERDAVQKSMQKAVDKNIEFSDDQVIYPTINTDVFKPRGRDELRKKLKLEDKFVILFVARNQMRKNTPVLIEAAKKLEKTISNIFVLIHSVTTFRPDGGFEGFYLNDIANELDAQDIIGDVKGFSGKSINELNIAELYNVADLYCLPTMGEGFGLMLQEAMASKTPIISTNYSAVSEVLADGRGVLVNPAAWYWTSGKYRHALLGVDDLANAIHRVWKNPDLRKSMTDKGYDWVQKFVPSEVVNRLEAQFKKAIDEDMQPLALKR